MGSNTEFMSGNKGKANAGGSEVLSLLSWTLADAAKEVQGYATSSTGALKKKNTGTGDFNGTIEVKLKPGQALPFSVGEYVDDVELHVDETGNNYWDCAVVITGFGSVTVDLNTGDAIGISYKFEGNGTFTPNGILKGFAA